MKSIRISIFTLLVIFLGACGSAPAEKSLKEQIDEHKKEVADLNRKIAELEKQLRESEGAEAGENAIPVEVMELSLQPFSHYIEVGGTAEAVKEAFISPEIGGQIREIYVKEGDFVERGQLLARLNTDVTETSIADLETSLQLATVVFEKQSRLWEKGIGSEIQYLEAKNSKESLEQKLLALKAQLEMAILKSPVTGIVDRINNKKGELAAPGVQIMQIVNLDELYINADVSEKYLSQVREGDKVKIEFPVYPGMIVEAPIYRKGQVINPGNRTFVVQLRLNNPDHMLKPNMLSVIHINDFASDSAIVVPSEVVRQDLIGSYLYVLQQNEGKLVSRKVYVTPGKSYLDKTMIVEGIQAGQRVIVQGFNLVSDGTEVYVKNQNVS